MVTLVAGLSQLEFIALDPEAEGGKGSVGSTAALNLDFSQTQMQATQGTQSQGPKVRLIVSCMPSAIEQAGFVPHMLITACRTKYLQAYAKFAFCNFLVQAYKVKHNMQCMERNAA